MIAKNKNKENKKEDKVRPLMFEVGPCLLFCSKFIYFLEATIWASRFLGTIEYSENSIV